MFLTNAAQWQRLRLAGIDLSYRTDRPWTNLPHQNRLNRFQAAKRNTIRRNWDDSDRWTKVDSSATPAPIAGVFLVPGAREPVYWTFNTEHRPWG
jgi:hypothetical protein